MLRRITGQTRGFPLHNSVLKGEVALAKDRWARIIALRSTSRLPSVFAVKVVVSAALIGTNLPSSRLLKKSYSVEIDHRRHDDGINRTRISPQLALSRLPGDAREFHAGVEGGAFKPLVAAFIGAGPVYELILRSRFIWAGWTGGIWFPHSRIHRDGQGGEINTSTVD